MGHGCQVASDPADEVWGGERGHVSPCRGHLGCQNHYLAGSGRHRLQLLIKGSDKKEVAADALIALNALLF